MSTRTSGVALSRRAESDGWERHGLRVRVTRARASGRDEWVGDYSESDEEQASLD